MATTPIAKQSGNSIAWTYTDLNTTGTAFEGWMFPDKTIQAAGTGTVTLEGSPDGTNWAALNDTAGAAISLAAASEGASVVLENTKWYRAIVAGGTATVVITGAR
jgi:hypothetical protein